MRVRQAKQTVCSGGDPSDRSFYTLSECRHRRRSSEQHLPAHYPRKAHVDWRLIVLSFCLLCGGISFWWFSTPPSAPSEELLQAAKRALDAGDMILADKLTQQILASQENHAPALLIASQIAQRNQDPRKTLSLLEKITDSSTPHALTARLTAGRIFAEQTFQLSAAIDQFRRAVQLDPNNEVAHRALADLLGLTAQSWEAIPHRVAKIRLGQIDNIGLVLLSQAGDKRENPTRLQTFHRSDLDDPAPRVGLARQLIDEQKYAEAETMLRAAIDRNPKFLPAFVMLGELLIATSQSQALIDWHLALPPTADSHPRIWRIRGTVAETLQETDVAIRCYWEALQSDPNDQLSNYRLGRLLLPSGATEKAQTYLARSDALQRYRDTVETAATKDMSAIEATVTQAESLGLWWEAKGWLELALSLDSNLPWAKNKLSQLNPLLTQNSPGRTANASLSVQAFDFSAKPLPHWDHSSSGLKRETETGSIPAHIAFRDMARETSLRFQYFNGGNPQTTQRRMFEFSGGGVTILDFDGDGHPDIYLTQGNQWPPDQGRASLTDQLFRNQGSRGFVNQTSESKIVESAYSQGATVGDFDNDGFPDLYVANIGGNRLWRNNGDGTFTDWTDQAEIGGERWTTSCMMADLNGDSFPDIYAVGYLGGPDVFKRVCGSQGTESPCRVHLFSSEQDQLYLNLGDGTFREITETSGIVLEDGNGLGILGADFRGVGQLDVFIANDAVANFYFRNLGKQTKSDDLFSNHALLAGIGLNGSGKAEACMGVACGDVNGDGRLDIYATNFYMESNTLFVQQPDGSFQDETLERGLYDSTLPLLGFGTQFIDADLDGDLDLVTTNGDVGRFPNPHRPYRMRPCVHENRGQGHFVELDSDQLGDFFRGKYLGRGLAKLDWNRDGRPDVVVSHLDAPVALLTNVSQQKNHFLSIRLVGVTASRDAIGTNVLLTNGDVTTLRQQTAGDGYQASNERVLIFGLGTRKRVDRLEIRWLSGNVQEFDDILADQEITIIEGHDQIF